MCFARNSTLERSGSIRQIVCAMPGVLAVSVLCVRIEVISWSLARLTAQPAAL
jgi:hypothetical protein